MTDTNGQVSLEGWSVNWPTFDIFLMLAAPVALFLSALRVQGTQAQVGKMRDGPFPAIQGVNWSNTAECEFRKSIKPMTDKIASNVRR